ncbi:MAG: NAD(+) synthase [Culicoidibacterales bacterium]
MDLQAYIDYLVTWLQETVAKTGTKGLIVGVSGGIDSALVAHLIKRACPQTSLGVILPCNSNPQDKADALAVIASAGIDFVEVDLSATRDALIGEIREVTETTTPQWQLVDGNLRARLRMTTLYALAQNHGYLVVGTDNAAEWHTGYFTKFGDGGVDLVPLVHLTKGQVREAARLVGVPEQVITKAPTAGLWEGQTDENEMGTTYDMIDAYLLGETIPDHDRQIIERLHTVSAHKRTTAAAPVSMHGETK